MDRTATLHVFVQNPDQEPLTDAVVELESDAIKGSKRLEYAEAHLRYEAEDLEPGSYSLRIRSKEFPGASIDRTIELEPGTTVVHEMIGPEEMRYYQTGERERVYFESDEDQILLSVRGQNARAISEYVLDEFDLEWTDVLAETADENFPLEAGEPSANEVWFLVDISEYADERTEFLQELRNAFYPPLSTSVVAAVPSRPSVQISVPMFHGDDDEGRTVKGLTDEVIVRFDGSVTENEARRLADQYDCDQERPIPYAGNAYLWRYTETLDYDLLDVIDRIHQHPNVEYAEPNVVSRLDLDQYVPNDFLFPEQPHFGVIDNEEAWDTLDDISVNRRFGSSDITVAVFDPLGVDPTHSALTGTLTDGSDKMTANYDFVTMSAQTRANLGGAHGTQCASSAVAQTDDTVGVSGVAGNCHLIGAKLPNVSTGLNMADAWIWAAGFQPGNPSFPTPPTNGADVISNSWGIDGGALNSILRDTFDFLSTYGRNGRGCVVCFSIGNNGYNPFTTGPVARRYAAYERTIAVGASISANPTTPVNSEWPDPNGNTTNLPAAVDTRAYYSTYGTALDIVAPSHTSHDRSATPREFYDMIVSADVTGQGNWIGDAVTMTTLAADANTGDTSLDLADTSGFAAAGAALLGTLGTATDEFVRITGVGGGELQIDADPLIAGQQGLDNDHPSGTQVATGPNDYSKLFGGTSHACPTVAGAAALILSVRPELTWVQVRDILRSTAVRIDTGQTNAIGQWVDNDGDGVAEFSQWYGYGRLDVNAAVEAARDFVPAEAADVVVRDNLTDDGSVPSPGWHAHSPDIWVRQSDEPIPTLGYSDAPPHQNAQRGQDNYVYLRVRNRGSQPTSTFYLRALITHFPGMEFRYPEDWQPSTRPGAAVPDPLVPGSYLIGETPIDSLPAGDDTIVKMTWDEALVPPEEVVVGGVPVRWHPCLLAEVSPHDGPSPSGATGYPVRHDNNLAQRNIAIGGTDTDEDFVFGVVAGTATDYDVASVVLDRSQLNDDCRVFASVADEELLEQWLTAFEDRRIRPTSPLPRTDGDGDDRPRAGSKRRRQRQPAGGLAITVTEETQLEIECDDGSSITVNAPEGTRLTCSGHRDPSAGKPELELGEYEGRQILYFDGGADAIDIPLRLPSGTFVPLIVGVEQPRGAGGCGTLRTTQRLSNGLLSMGYTFQG